MQIRTSAAVTVALLLASSVAARAETEEKIKFADAPAAVRAAFEKELPGVEIKRLEKETEDGHTTYEAEVTINHEKIDVVVSEDGKHVSRHAADDDDDADDIELKDLPANVREAMLAESKGAELDDIEKAEKNGKTTYHAEFEREGKKYTITVDEKGKAKTKEKKHDK